MAEEKDEEMPEQGDAKPEAEGASAESKKEEAKDSLKHFIRIANTDIPGVKNIVVGLRKVKGINMMFASALCRIAGIDSKTKSGALNESQVKKLNEIAKEPAKYGIPSWMFNRRKDVSDGTDKHLLMGDLQFAKENDIKIMRKIKCYKGIRHSFGLPVRGQKTRSNFRKNKTKGKSSLGVKKSPAAKAAGSAAK